MDQNSPHFSVALLESLSPKAEKLLQTQCVVSSRPLDGEECKAIRAIITRGKEQVRKAHIDQCPALQVIARCGIGLNNIDVEYASKRGIPVINLPGANADTVAEHAMSLMLALQRKVLELNKLVKDGQWQLRNDYDGDEIRGKKLGIIGMGNIGLKVAQLANAFGMEVVFWNRSDRALPYEQLELNSLLSQADILSLHLPLTDATRHMLDAENLKRVKPGCKIINTGRGQLIDEIALADGLATGAIGGFAADVLAKQPPALDSPLLHLPNVILTPHAASLTKRTFDEMSVQTVNNVLDILNGEKISTQYIFNRSNLST